MISIVIPEPMAALLRRHFFQNSLEQGAFLFARVEQKGESLDFFVVDQYLVPESGWERQHEVYLQMKDSERAKIMKMARDKGLSAIDCHSHPGADDDVWFSPSDVSGISEFAPYAKWKLSGRPFAATVWAERSIDAVAWYGDFSKALPVSEIRIVGAETVLLEPKNSWFSSPRGWHRFESHE
jgi:proteasome lid subunit RPN8/RPN11